MTPALVADVFHEAGYSASHGTDVRLVSQISAYLSEIQLWNRKHNLTAITDTHEMMVKHVLDSLSLDTYLSGEQILDVGSGAGFPGIPLALTNPERHFTLVDALAKRITFLQHICGICQLSNVQVRHARIEEMTDQQYDTIICRAFTKLSGFVQSTLPLLAHNGRLIAMKGAEIETELIELNAWLTQRDHEVDTASGTVQAKMPRLTIETIPVTVPLLNATRHFVIISPS